MIKVLALVPALLNTSPGQRFRLEQWAPYLAQEGIDITFLPFGDQALHQALYQPGQYFRKAHLMARSFIHRLQALTLLESFDLVILYREASLVGPAIVERLMARRQIPILYDFDDPIWMSYRSPTNGLFSYLKFPGKTATICRLATTVTVGNSLLATYAQTYAKQVYVVPSTVDMTQYPPKSYHIVPDRITLGWTGSHSTLPFLETLKPVLGKLADRYPQRLRFLVISHTDQYRMDDVPMEVVSQRWQAETEAIDLHAMDIGLAPFPNTGWTPWRCHGKVLQYMAVGIPTVTSAIGILPEYIQSGVNGSLAASETDWVKQISQLIENASLRQTMGAAGRETITQRYSAQAWVPKIKAILENTLG